MKILLVSLFLWLASVTYSQSILSDSFKIGNYLEVFQKDSLKIYFGCTGVIVDKKCASYYRIGRMDSSIINVSGKFQDYYISGQLFFVATMVNNFLEGHSFYYYPDGTLKEEGSYKRGIRDGIWKYYYSNGKIEKLFNYVNGNPLVMEAYDSKGIPSVLNGNGHIKTTIRTYKQCDYFEVWGDIVNGEKNGKWTISNPGAATPFGFETFENGNFIKENESYDNARIVLTTYTPNENLNMMESYLGCPGSTISFFEYKNEGLHETFYPELQEKLDKYENDLKDQWLVIGITISKKSRISEINVASSIDDTNLENYIYSTLSKMTDWQTAKINSIKTETNIYFSILISNNQVIIPTDYIFKKEYN